jgi:hypothetical protein
MMKLRRMRREWHVACIREVKNPNEILVLKPEAKRELGTRRCRQDNIKNDLKESVGCAKLAQKGFSVGLLCTS